MQQAERVTRTNRRQEAERSLDAGAAHAGREVLAELAHDARNMVTALALFCELLEEPGVLTPQGQHFAQDLRIVTQASRRLQERLFDAENCSPSFTASGWKGARLIEALPGTHPVTASGASDESGFYVLGVASLADELALNRNLLAALAGPGVTLRLRVDGGERQVGMSGEDLTRVLVNLVRNAAEAMGGSGDLNIHLEEGGADCAGVTEEAGAADGWLSLTVEDSGPGIAQKDLGRIFEAGYSRQSRSLTQSARHERGRGLGLSIVRKLVEAAGGRVTASNRAAGGARFAIALPVRTA